MFRYINSEFVFGAWPKPIFQARLHSQPPFRVLNSLLIYQISSVAALCTIHSLSNGVTSLIRASLSKRTARVRRTWRNVRLVSPEPGPNSIICAIGLDRVLSRGAVYVRAISRSTGVHPTSCQIYMLYQSLRLDDRGNMVQLPARATDLPLPPTVQTTRPLIRSSEGKAVAASSWTLTRI